MKCPGLSVFGAAFYLSLLSSTALTSDSGGQSAATTAAAATWSSPMQIAATTGVTTAPKLVTNASGTSLATWVETIPNTLNARIFTPGAGWGRPFSSRTGVGFYSRLSGRRLAMTARPSSAGARSWKQPRLKVRSSPAITRRARDGVLRRSSPPLAVSARRQ
jgi:hypothetical protein